MTKHDPDTLTVEGRLRASVMLAVSLQQTALQTRPHDSRGDMDPCSPSVLVSLAPAFCTMIIDHLQAVRFALSTERALEWAPLPWSSNMRLVDVVVAMGRKDEQRVLECADREAVRVQGWRGLCWNPSAESDELAEDAVQRLTREIEHETPRYAQALDALARHRASGGDRPPFEAALHARACEARAAYYLGLARGWYAAMGCCAGLR